MKTFNKRQDLIDNVKSIYIGELVKVQMEDSIPWQSFQEANASHLSITYIDAPLQKVPTGENWKSELREVTSTIKQARFTRLSKHDNWLVYRRLS